MKVLIDTNVLLDVLMPRPPFFAASALVWAMAETKQFEPLVCAVTLTTIRYLVDRQSGQVAADAAVRVVHQLGQTTAVDSRTVTDAISSGNLDFEDAVQPASAREAGATHVVTRDPRGFAGTGLTVVSPAQLVALMSPPLLPP